MKDLGITKGKWIVEDQKFGNDITVLTNCKKGTFIADFPAAWNNKLANANLVANAGNTTQKCGLLPSELLAQRDELLKNLARCVDRLEENGYGDMNAVARAKQAIKKATE